MLTLIRSAVADFYSQLDPWHNLNHGVRVVAVALEINRAENGNAFLVEAGAWLHQFHHPHLDKLEPILDALPLTDLQRNQLREIVQFCRPEAISATNSLEARIVFDADALDLIGPSGIFREILCNMITRKQTQSQAIENAQTVQHMFADKLQTETGRALAQSGKRISAEFWAEFSRYEEFLHGADAPSY